MATSKQPRDLLLQPEASNEEIERLLAPIGFDNWLQAYHCLRRIPDSPAANLALADGLPHLLMALSTAAHPDRVLVSFERFIQNLM